MFNTPEKIRKYRAESPRTPDRDGTPPKKPRTQWPQYLKGAHFHELEKPTNDPKVVAKSVLKYFCAEYENEHIGYQLYELYLQYAYSVQVRWVVDLLNQSLTSLELALMWRYFESPECVDKIAENIVLAGGLSPEAAAELAASDLPASFKQQFLKTDL